MAKNSQRTPVKLTEFYSEEYKNRECCWCKTKLVYSGTGQPRVACSKECYRKAVSYAQKSIRDMACPICGEDRLAGRTDRSSLCGSDGCRKEANWRRNLFRVHHIRADQFYQMAEDQEWRCAVCKNDLVFSIDGSKSQINVDHDHSCCPGRIGCGDCVRGILCNGCNGGIGLLKDDPQSLLSAAEYLLAYRKKRGMK